MKIKSLRNGEITLLFTDIGESCPSRKFLTSQICLLMLFAKINFSRKFPDLQYPFGKALKNILPNYMTLTFDLLLKTNK